MDDMANRSVLEPLLLGTYPGRVLQRMHAFVPATLEKDLGEMKKPGTYVGLNYYARNLYRWSRFLPFLHASEYMAPGAQHSAMWEIYPPGSSQPCSA